MTDLYRPRTRRPTPGESRWCGRWSRWRGCRCESVPKVCSLRHPRYSGSVTSLSLARIATTTSRPRLPSAWAYSSKTPCGGENARVTSRRGGHRLAGTRRPRPSAVPVRPDPSAVGSCRRHAPTGSSPPRSACAGPGSPTPAALAAAPRRSLRQRDHRPLSPEEPDAQEQPWHSDGEDGWGGHRDRQQDRQPRRGGVEVLPAPARVQCRLAGGPQRFGHRVADQWDAVCAVAGGVEVLGDPRWRCR